MLVYTCFILLHHLLRNLQCIRQLTVSPAPSEPRFDEPFSQIVDTSYIKKVESPFLYGFVFFKILTYLICKL